jgi:glycolate oxidase FAD binding subunit
VEVADGAAAHALAAAILDSTLQPSRVELLNGVALTAVGEPGDAALAVSIGTVEAAVRAQAAALGELAARAGGSVRPVDASFWSRYAAMQDTAGGVGLRVSTLVSRLTDTLAEIERATAVSAPGATANVSGCATLGALRAFVAGADVPAAVRLIERLRAFLAADGGSVVVERGSLALRAAVDPWGAVEPGQLALMRRIKYEFDPAGVLNPGRFVGGL